MNPLSSELPFHVHNWLLIRLAPTWQYFGTITCEGLHGIMKLYIDNDTLSSLIKPKSEFSAPLLCALQIGTILVSSRSLQECSLRRDAAYYYRYRYIPKLFTCGALKIFFSKNVHLHCKI